MFIFEDAGFQCKCLCFFSPKSFSRELLVQSRSTPVKSHQALPLQMWPLLSSPHFLQSPKFFLEMLYGLQDTALLGIIRCLLSVKEEVLDGFCQQHFWVFSFWVQPQHPLTSNGVIFVPVHWIRFLCTYDVLVQLVSKSIKLCFHFCGYGCGFCKVKEEEGRFHPCLPHFFICYSFPRRRFKPLIWFAPVIEISGSINPLSWIKWGLGRH